MSDNMEDAVPQPSAEDTAPQELEGAQAAPVDVNPTEETLEDAPVDELVSPPLHEEEEEERLDDEGDDSNVRTAVAPARHIVGYDEVEAPEEELPDQVGSDVRPAAQVDLEALPASDTQLSSAIGPDAPALTEDADTATAVDGVAALARLNPSQGVQAEAQVVATPAPMTTTSIASGATQTAAVNVNVTEAPLTGHCPDISEEKQAYEGTVTITLTLMPMQARSILTHSVRRAIADDSGEDGWMLVAKDAFEAIAWQLRVHPQRFQLYRGSERVRFTASVFLERDRTGGHAATQAEPLWLTVTFPEHDPSMSIPPYLAQLGPGDVLLKCCEVCRRKPDIHPSTLVESKLRHGLSYGESIKRITHDPALRTDPSVMTIVSLVAQASGGSTRKPFIGGFRDRCDHSRVFHHATTQLFMKDMNYSPFQERRVPVADLQSRQTQTWGTSRGCQTRREGCVQTLRPDLVLETSSEVYMVARPYFSAAELRALRTDKAITLQKLYRQWKARRLRRELEEEEAEKQRRAEARQRAEEAARAAREDEKQQRREDPKTAADFDQLKSEIMAWRAAEASDIAGNPMLSTEERREAMLALTKRQLGLLQDLEHHRRQTLLVAQDHRFDRTMERMSAPKQWGAVAVETPETERAGELRDLYNGLSGGAGSSAERLDILLHVKWTVREFESELTRELCQLIDREADLLHRGRKEASLTGLRKRIVDLFKRFLEDPEYNPGMASYTRTATGRAKARAIYGTVYPQDVVAADSAFYGSATDGSGTTSYRRSTKALTSTTHSRVKGSATHSGK